MAKLERVVEEAMKENIDAVTANKYINELERSGDIFRPRSGVVKIVRHEAE